MICCAMAVAQSHSATEVSGVLTIGEGASAQKIELKYAYAAVGLNYGRSDKPTLVLFTDKPLPEDPVERLHYLTAMTAQNRLNALYVEIERKMVRTSYALCASCQTTSKTFGNKIYFTNREEQEMDEEDDEQDFDLKTLDAQTISGTVYSTVLYDASALDELRISSANDEGKPPQKPQAAYQYRVTFRTAIRGAYEKAKLLPESGGDPGAAYQAFRSAAENQNAADLKRLLSASALKSFSGTTAQLARVKLFVEPFKLVNRSIISTTGKYAFLYLRDIPYKLPAGVKAPVPEPPGSLVEVYGDPLFSLPMPPPPSPPMSAMPPPPPPPPPGAKKSMKGRPGGVPGGVPGGRPAMERYPKDAEVRMVLEGGQWKVDWFFVHHDTVNLLAQLDTYKTGEERYVEMTKAEEEAQRGEEAERWKIENARPLPTGGGNAGKAYLEFCQAERAGNKKELVKYLTGAQFDLYNNPGLTIKKGAFIWKESSALDYANLEIVSGVANDEEAILEVQAVRQGYRTTGKVFMILEDGQWKVDEEKWQTDTSKKVSGNN
jgi:hypothetical protein